MKDPQRRMSAVKRATEKAYCSMAHENMTARVLNCIQSLDGDMKSVAAEFNEIRAQLVNLSGNILKEMNSKMLQYVVMSKAIAQGDYGALLVETPALKGTAFMQDSAEFTKFVKDICDEPSYEMRIKMFLQAKRAISRAIQDLTGKINKMNSLSTAVGSSDNEVSVASDRILKFEAAVVTLKKRSAFLGKMYRETSRAARSFIENSDKKFKSIEI